MRHLGIEVCINYGHIPICYIIINFVYHSDFKIKIPFRECYSYIKGYTLSFIIKLLSLWQSLEEIGGNQITQWTFKYICYATSYLLLKLIRDERDTLFCNNNNSVNKKFWFYSSVTKTSEIINNLKFVLKRHIIDIKQEMLNTNYSS